MTSTADWLSRRITDIQAAAEAKGRIAEVRRWTDLLMRHGVLSDSQLGPGWALMQTANGPIDIRLEELTGIPAEEKEEK